jgi:hypothetical protein
MSVLYYGNLEQLYLKDMLAIINKIQVEETINVLQSDKPVVKKVIIDCTDDEVNQIRDVEDGLQPSDTGNNY